MWMMPSATCAEAEGLINRGNVRRQQGRNNVAIEPGGRVGHFGEAATTLPAHQRPPACHASPAT